MANASHAKGLPPLPAPKSHDMPDEGDNKPHEMRPGMHVSCKGAGCGKMKALHTSGTHPTGDSDAATTEASADKPVAEVDMHDDKCMPNGKTKFFPMTMLAMMDDDGDMDDKALDKAKKGETDEGEISDKPPKKKPPGAVDEEAEAEAEGKSQTLDDEEDAEADDKSKKGETDEGEIGKKPPKKKPEGEADREAEAKAKTKAMTETAGTSGGYAVDEDQDAETDPTVDLPVANMVRRGDHVRITKGCKGVGVVMSVHDDGDFVPDVEDHIVGTKEEPAVKVHRYKAMGDGHLPTNHYSAHKAMHVEKMADMRKPSTRKQVTPAVRPINLPELPPALPSLVGAKSSDQINREREDAQYALFARVIDDAFRVKIRGEV